MRTMNRRILELAALTVMLLSIVSCSRLSDRIDLARDSRGTLKVDERKFFELDAYGGTYNRVLRGGYDLLQSDYYTVQYYARLMNIPVFGDKESAYAEINILINIPSSLFKDGSREFSSTDNKIDCAGFNVTVSDMPYLYTRSWKLKLSNGWEEDISEAEGKIE